MGAMKGESAQRGSVLLEAGRRFGSEPGLFARRLVVDELSFTHQIPALRRHAIVVVGDRRKTMRLGAVGDHVHPLRAVLEFPQLVGGEKARARIVGLVAERAVELGRVAAAFVNRQPKVRRVQQQIVLPGLDRWRLELLHGLFSGLRGFFQIGEFLDRLPAALYRQRQRAS